jgi:hypothetical protein
MWSQSDDCGLMRLVLWVATVSGGRLFIVLNFRFPEIKQDNKMMTISRRHLPAQSLPEVSGHSGR